jgi:ANTAR domain
MIDSSDSSQSWPQVLFEQATGILMNRFDLDAAHASQVLRKMSQNTRTQMCVVAEQLINNDVPLEALRGIEDVMYSAPADPSEESA